MRYFHAVAVLLVSAVAFAQQPFDAVPPRLDQTAQTALGDDFCKTALKAVHLIDRRENASRTLRDLKSGAKTEGEKEIAEVLYKYQFLIAWARVDGFVSQNRVDGCRDALESALRSRAIYSPLWQCDID